MFLKSTIKVISKKPKLEYFAVSTIESEGGEDIRVEMEGSPLHRNHRRKWPHQEVARVQREGVLREVSRPLLR